MESIPEYREAIKTLCGLYLVTMFDEDNNIDIYIGDDVLATLVFTQEGSKIVVYKETAGILKLSHKSDFVWSEANYRMTSISLWECIHELLTVKGPENA